MVCDRHRAARHGRHAPRPAFDNHFWLDLVPKHYAALHGITVAESLARLRLKFRAVEGTLDWYSTDYWSRELGFDVMTVKQDVRERVTFQPGAERFLGRLATLGKRRVLLTNAHPRVLAIKDGQVGLARTSRSCTRRTRSGCRRNIRNSGALSGARAVRRRAHAVRR